MSTKTQFDKKPMAYAFIGLLIGFMPLMYIHELGHLAVCNAYGYEGQINNYLFAASMNCFGEVPNKFVYGIMGGLLAVAVSLTPLAVLQKKIWDHKWILIPVLGFVIGHGTNAILEGFFYHAYVDNTQMMMLIINMVQMIGFIALAVRYASRPVQKQTNKHKVSKLG